MKKPEKNATFEYAGDDIVNRLKAIMRAHVEDGMNPAGIHHLLEADLGVNGDGKRLMLHETQVWDIVQHAFKKDYYWATQFAVANRYVKPSVNRFGKR